MTQTAPPNGRQVNQDTVTASHMPYSDGGVGSGVDLPRAARRAQKRLLSLNGKLGSWAAVEKAVGVDRGLARRVALGRQKAPRAVIDALYPPKSPRQPRYRPTLADVRLLYWAVLALMNGKL